MDNNTKLNVTVNGNNLTIDVIDIIDNLDANKEYIIYTMEGNDEDIYMSILEENEDSFTLKEISDENEAKMVEDYLEKTLGDEDNNG